MRIESLSIRAATIIIFTMIGVVAIVLSLFAGDYFKKAALDAQINSLSRVIEVASQEMLKEVQGHTFDLGTKLAHSNEIISAVKAGDQENARQKLIAILDDPFINGFVGFPNLNLQKIRVYNPAYQLVAESNEGLKGLSLDMPDYLLSIINKRTGVERLKAVDALWVSAHGPLYSTLVPIGGLRLVGYLEIVIDPVFNLPEISKITKRP